MEKWTHSISRKLNRLQNRFESLLENENSKSDPDSPAFEPSRDPSLVAGISLGLPEDHVDRAVILFSRLAMIFDSGILLENQDGRWKAQATFSEGVARPLRKNSDQTVTLPEMNSLSVLKAKSFSLIKQLGIPEEQNSIFLNEAYIIRPVPDFAFILCSSLPDLWLKDHLERTTMALSRGFSQ